MAESQAGTDVATPTANGDTAERSLDNRRSSSQAGKPVQRRASDRRSRQQAAARAKKRKEEKDEKERQLQEFLAYRRWRNEATRSRVYVGSVLSVAAILVGLAVLASVFGESVGMQFRGQLLAVTGFSVLAFVFAITAVLIPPLRRAIAQQREDEAEARKAAKAAVGELARATDLRALIIANRDQIDAYDLLARSQAKTAFRNSQIAMAVGLLALILGATASLIAHDTPSKVTTAALTGLAGAFSGFIARTFLRSYDRSLEQLNFYFEQPLVNSYLLSAERLISAMSKPNRDPALSGVIEHMTDVLIRLPRDGRDSGRNGQLSSLLRGRRNQMDAPQPDREGQLAGGSPA